MERILSDLADTILVPGVETTEVILQWFRRSNLSNNIIISCTTGLDTSSAFHVTLPPRDNPCLGSVTNANGWVIYVNSTIDVTTWKLFYWDQQK